MKQLLSLSLLLILLGCSKEPSLQKYFVEKSESKDFVALDVSPTILNIQKQSLTAEEKQAVEAFDKINILAFKKNDSNQAEFEKERANVTAILKDEKYQELMKFGSGKEGASLKFIGDENNIEEFILYANKNDAGFAVVRVLGKDMTPTDIMNMIGVIRNSKMDMEQLKPIQEMLTTKN